MVGVSGALVVVNVIVVIQGREPRPVHGRYRKVIWSRFGRW